MRAYFVHPAAPGGLIFEFPGAFFCPFRLPPGSPKERKVALEESSTRIAVIGIIIEDRRQAEKINALLHQYGSYVIGRMGLPYEKKQVNIMGNNCGLLGDGGVDTSLLFFFLLLVIIFCNCYGH